jgi:hypothetical protein
MYGVFCGVDIGYYKGKLDLFIKINKISPKRGY